VSFPKDPASGAFVPSVTGIQWTQPGDATGLVAIPGPHAVTLAWRPPADALGVKYEIRERAPDGSSLPIAAVGGAWSFQDLLARESAAARRPTPTQRRGGGPHSAPLLRISSAGV
jgi:hypothetical protein